MSSADEIKKLKDLLDDGAITLEEFEQQKKIILDSQKQNETNSPFSKLNFKKINFTSKNKKILYIVIALLILFPFRYNLFPSTNSSDLINLLKKMILLILSHSIHLVMKNKIEIVKGFGEIGTDILKKLNFRSEAITKVVKYFFVLVGLNVMICTITLQI